MQLDNFLLKNHKFFSNPKVMACSGLLAMVFKWSVSGVIAVPLVVLFKRQQPIAAFFVFAALVFPIVGLIVDLKLNALKNKIWSVLPTEVPSNWDITSEQLLEYAKCLPKVRLMRFLSCWILLPMLPFIEGGKEWYLFMLPALVEGFFIVALFDGVWLRFFKITRPEFPIQYTKIPPSKDPYSIDEMMERNRKAGDIMFPGSPAWFAKKHLNSL